MNIKRYVLPLLASLAFASCGPSLRQVPFMPQGTAVEGSIRLDSFADFEALIMEADTFLLTITNMTCSCTHDFLPHYNRYLQEKDIVGYDMEYSQVLHQTDKKGLPVTDANSPILAIFEAGLLVYSYAYETGDAKHNVVLNSYEGLVDYLEDRIDVA